MKEVIMQQTEEMTTFGSVWKRFEPVKELVRCKDCRWWHENPLCKGMGDCGQANGIAMKPHDWFCADGKRKED